MGKMIYNEWKNGREPNIQFFKNTLEYEKLNEPFIEKEGIPDDADVEDYSLKILEQL